MAAAIIAQRGGDFAGLLVAPKVGFIRKEYTKNLYMGILRRKFL
jgi:hypothetical protein